MVSRTLTQATASSWDPIDKYKRLDAELKKYLDGPDQLPRVSQGDGFAPEADVEETNEAYAIELDLPGVSRDDVTLSISGRRLRISGVRNEREHKGIVRRRTRNAGPFCLEVTFPEEVEEVAITASLRAGVLSVRAPKRNPARPRQVTIN